MNIIREQREHILTQNNTATTQLLAVLEQTNKRIETLTIKESLHGDLDFSVIKEMGFGLLREIILDKGDVTSVTNLPDGLVKFTCNDNLLVALENLPVTLEELDVNNNYIEELKLDYLKKLRVLKCESNRLSILENLPTLLEEIYCDNNRLLNTIKLGNIRTLSVLHISNTNVHIIYDFPEGVTDFVMENTPTIEFRHASGVPSTIRDAENEDQKRNKSYVDALNEYFKLKSSYEKELMKAKRNVYEKAPTKKMGRTSVKAVKIPCIKCKRPVGTQFLIKDNKYIALCGDTRNPCNLDIQIYNGTLINYAKYMQAYKDDIELSKQTIIRDKLDVLFSYITEQQSVAEFKRDLDEYNINVRMYEELLVVHNEIYNNEVTEEQIVKKNEALFKLNESVYALIVEYENTRNQHILEEVVRIQYEQIGAEMRNLRMLKYEVMEMDKREPTVENENQMIVLDKNCQLDVKSKGERGMHEYALVQRPCVITKMEFSIEEPPDVIKFVK